MSIYGEFDPRFRPRPTLLRLFLAALGTTVAAVWIASTLLSALDMVVLRRAGLVHAWLVYATPWQRILELERLSGFRIVIEDQRANDAPVLALATAILALLIYFWPVAPSIGRRMFLMTLTEAMLLFTAMPLVAPIASHLSSDRNLAIAVAAALLTLILVPKAEARINDDLATALPMATPGRRFVVWLVRALPPLALLAAAAYWNQYLEGAFAALVLLVISLLVALGHRPAGYVKLDGSELREAAAVAPLVAAVLVAAGVFLFGFGTLRRTFVITKSVHLQTWSEARGSLARWWR